MPLFSYPFQKNMERMKMILLLLLVQREIMERAILEGFPLCDAEWKVEPYRLPFDILKHTLDHLARKDWVTWLPLSTPVCKFQVYKGSSALFSSNRTKHVRVLLLCLCAGTGCDGPGIFTFAISCPWLIFERLVRVLWCMLWIFSVCFQHDNEICVFF